MHSTARETKFNAAGGCASRLLSVFAALTLLAIAFRLRVAAIPVLLDVLFAIFIITPPILAGLWIVPPLRLGSMPVRWHLLIGAATGLGLTSLLVLCMGLLGSMHRSVWIGLLVVLAAAGVVRLRQFFAPVEENAESPVACEDETCGSWRWLWLLACPFLVLAVLSAANPPGFVWSEEGFGYDVLEYHLQLPKEYVQLGRIDYLPHNVYANFPSNVEMLYTMAMVVLDDSSDVGVVANVIHLVLAVLTVFAAWVAGTTWSPKAGLVCGLAMATTGWLVYLSGLAYVENGMLFFAMASAAILMRFSKRIDHLGTSANGAGRRQPVESPWRWAALAGAFSGFAGGCKYTGLAMVAGPLAIAAFLLLGRSLRNRIAGTIVFSMAVLITTGPWLIKNTIYTGNPVFPLLSGAFDSSPRGWSTEETVRWDQSHSIPSNRRAISARVRAFWSQVLGDRYQRFGPLLFLLAIAGLCSTRPTRIDAALWIVLFIQIAVWLLATHMFARFAVVFMIPLVLLCGRVLASKRSVFFQAGVVAVLVVGGAWNFVFAARLQEDESAAGAPASLIYAGRLRGYEYFRLINNELPSDARILLVGESKAFYYQPHVDYCTTFNRNPFFEAIGNARFDADVLDWLVEQNYTHVLVHWGELRRLHATYGFSSSITPADLETLFDSLGQHGLTLVESFKSPSSVGRYVDVFEVKR